MICSFRPFLTTDLEHDGDCWVFLHVLSPNYGDDTFATVALFRVQAESQVIHQCLIHPTQSPIPPVFFSHHHHCLRSQEDTLSVCVRKRSERTFPQPHQMTWLYISNMQPSFDKSLFRLVGAEYHKSAIAHCTVLSVKNSILQEIFAHPVLGRIRRPNRGYPAQVQLFAFMKSIISDPRKYPCAFDRDKITVFEKIHMHAASLPPT